MRLVSRDQVVEVTFNRVAGVVEVVRGKSFRRNVVVRTSVTEITEYDARQNKIEVGSGFLSPM